MSIIIIIYLNLKINIVTFPCGKNKFQPRTHTQVIKICPDQTLLESLRECIGLLNVAQKGLSDYLETKRLLFPRFFFLSDDELLEILAQAKNVRAVQPHLKKCFENMKQLEFEDDLRITKMYSADGEEVALTPTIYPEGNVEDWLLLVESSMRNTLRTVFGKSLSLVNNLPRNSWVNMWPGQVTLGAGQTHWTASVEHGILSRSLSAYYDVMLTQVYIVHRYFELLYSIWEK